MSDQVEAPSPRRGRPVKEDKRANSVRVLLSDKEYDQLVAECDRTGKTMSVLLRENAFAMIRRRLDRLFKATPDEDMVDGDD